MTRFAFSGSAACVVLLLSVCVSLSSFADEPRRVVPARFAGGGSDLVAYCMNGRPPAVLPPYNAPVRPAAAGKILPNVPASTWCYGCANTAAAIVMGYYDRIGYPNMYNGPAAGVSPRGVSSEATKGLYPMYNEAAWPDTLLNPQDGESPLAASHKGIDGRTVNGNVDDWWSAYNSTIDPCLDSSPPWEPHTLNDSLADFMWTSRYDKYNIDGSTQFVNGSLGFATVDFTDWEPDLRDGGHGMKLFAESRGYEVETVFNQLILPTPEGHHNYRGFTYDDYKAEIDAGRPVLLMCGTHAFVGYGYTSGTEECYIRTTWDNDPGNNRVIAWGGTYGGQTMWAVTVIRLKAPAPTYWPDISVKDVTGTWVGDGNQDPGAAAQLGAEPQKVAVFQLQLRNGGNQPNQFKMRGPAGNSMWTVRYFDAPTGGNDITSSVTGAEGWTTPDIMAPYDTMFFRIEVTPTAAAPKGAILEIPIAVEAVAGTSWKDTVTARCLRLTADLTGDGIIDDKDTAAFVSAWRRYASTGLLEGNVDYNNDGGINTTDATRFIEMLLGRK